MSDTVAQLRVFDTAADGEGTERHHVAEALQGAHSLPPGTYRLVLHPADAAGVTTCPKCGHTSGGDWTQCKGACPMGGPNGVKVPAKSNGEGDYTRGTGSQEPEAGGAASRLPPSTSPAGVPETFDWRAVPQAPETGASAGVAGPHHQTFSPKDPHE